MAAQTFPISPSVTLHGMVYFKRMCDKIRLHSQGKLHPDYHPNLGLGMDLWTCQFLGISYAQVVEQIENGASDEQALIWCQENGVHRTEEELQWWSSYMRNRGFRDDLTEKLQQRKNEAALAKNDEIATFFDFINAEEGHTINSQDR